MVKETVKKLLKTIFIIAVVLILIIPKQEIATSKIKLGDINGDNKIDQTDIVFLLRHISATTNKNHEEWLLTGDKLKLADITDNNTIDTSDILALLRYIAANNSTEIAKKHPEWLNIKERESEPEPKKEPTEIKVTNVKLNKTTANLYMGKSEAITLKATIEPSNATNQKVTWTSSNKEVATVDENGKVKAKKNGTATITAKVDNKEIKCKIKVTTPATSIKLNKTSMEIKFDKTKTTTLKATILPKTTTDKTITWTSSNKEVAIVDKKGKVTAKKEGTVTITAKTTNGKKAKCKVTIKAGYWERKNGKYIYHYLNGTQKEWTVSEYTAWNKLKDQKVKALNPKDYKISGNKIFFAGMWQRYYNLDNTANKIAEKNGGSPYAITVDIDRKHESIFKNNGTNEMPIWEPIKSSRCRVGGKWKNFNNGKGTNDPRYYKKDTLTPIGLYYTNGNHSNIAVESYWKGKPPYWVGFGINYKWFDDGCCKDDYLHNTAFDLYNGPGTGGCIAVGEELSKWIYYNCGRGTPILTW